MDHQKETCARNNRDRFVDENTNPPKFPPWRGRGCHIRGTHDKKEAFVLLLWVSVTPHQKTWFADPCPMNTGCCNLLWGPSPNVAPLLLGVHSLTTRRAAMWPGIQGCGSWATTGVSGQPQTGHSDRAYQMTVLWKRYGQLPSLQPE